MPHARCPFEVTSFTPSAWGPESGEGMQLGRAALTKRFTGGELEATGTVEMLSARAGENAGTYIAMELVQGTLAGRPGSFVLQHGGTASAQSERTWVEVVEGSGTGALAGLSGRGRIEHGLLELEYELP